MLHLLSSIFLTKIEMLITLFSQTLTHITKLHFIMSENVSNKHYTGQQSVYIRSSCKEENTVHLQIYSFIINEYMLELILILTQFV